MTPEREYPHGRGNLYGTDEGREMVDRAFAAADLELAIHRAKDATAEKNWIDATNAWESAANHAEAIGMDREAADYRHLQKVTGRIAENAASRVVNVNTKELHVRTCLGRTLTLRVGDEVRDLNGERVTIQGFDVDEDDPSRVIVTLSNSTWAEPRDLREV